MVTYEPPSRPIHADDPFWGRYEMLEGLSIVRQNGVLGYLPSPSSEELEGLTAGVDFFLGGRIYEVTDETLEELIEMGFADASLGGYGFGPYGFGPYGG